MLSSMFNKECKHKWGKWKEEANLKGEDVYGDMHYKLIQSRTCSECNFKEIQKQYIRFN